VHASQFPCLCFSVLARLPILLPRCLRTKTFSAGRLGLQRHCFCGAEFTRHSEEVGWRRCSGVALGWWVTSLTSSADSSRFSEAVIPAKLSFQQSSTALVGFTPVRSSLWHRANRRKPVANGSDRPAFYSCLTRTDHPQLCARNPQASARHSTEARYTRNGELTAVRESVKGITRARSLRSPSLR